METKKSETINKIVIKQRSLSKKSKFVLLLAGGLVMAFVGLIFLWGVFGTDIWKTVVGIVLTIIGIASITVSVRFIDKIVNMKDMSKNTSTLYMVSFILFYIGVFIVGFAIAAEELGVWQLIVGLIILIAGVTGVIVIQKILMDKKNPAHAAKIEERKSAAKAKKEAKAKAKKESEAKKKAAVASTAKPEKKA